MVRAICIVGDAASGKTSTARELVRRLAGWRFVSTGERFRAYCDAHQIAAADIPTLPDAQHRAADDAMKQVLLAESQIVAEGRLVAYLAAGMPDVLRVYITAPLEVRIQRLVGREQFTAEDALRHITDRDGADVAKFRRLYGIDYHDPSYYDLVIDNTHLTIDQVADLILDHATA